MMMRSRSFFVPDAGFSAESDDEAASVAVKKLPDEVTTHSPKHRVIHDVQFHVHGAVAPAIRGNDPIGARECCQRCAISPGDMCPCISIFASGARAAPQGFARSVIARRAVSRARLFPPPAAMLPNANGCGFHAAPPGRRGGVRARLSPPRDGRRTSILTVRS